MATDDDSIISTWVAHWLFRAGAVLLFACPPVGAGAEPSSRYLIAISDVDVVATAYQDGNLGPVMAQRDTLSIFDLRGSGSHAIGTVHASNAVNTPAYILDVSSDGRTALVLESWKQRTPGATRIGDLKPGHSVQAFDLSEPAKPKLVSKRTVPEQPVAVDINSAGDLAVIVSSRIGAGLTFVPIRGGEFGEPRTIPVELPARPDISPTGSSIVQWHPSGRALAVNLMNRSQVAFFKVDRDADGSVVRVVPWGVVGVNKFPLAGRFTPDGRFYHTFDAQWGPDVPGTFNTPTYGILTTIKVGDFDAPENKPGHTQVSAVQGGWQGESMAISPDGKLLALSNSRLTTRLSDDSLYDPRASISLYRLDKESGVPRPIGEWFYEATNPQGIEFDADSRTLYVGVSEYRGEETPLKGAIEVWRFTDGDHPSLERTRRLFRAPRGVNAVAVAP